MGRSQALDRPFSEHDDCPLVLVVQVERRSAQRSLLVHWVDPLAIVQTDSLENGVDGRKSLALHWPAVPSVHMSLSG